MAEILHQLRLVVYPNYKVLYIPGGAGFQPSTVGFRLDRVWINNGQHFNVRALKIIIVVVAVVVVAIMIQYHQNQNVTFTMTNAAFLAGYHDACRKHLIAMFSRTDSMQWSSSSQWAGMSWPYLLCLFALFRQNQPGRIATNQMELLAPKQKVRSTQLTDELRWNLEKVSEPLRNQISDQNNFGQLCETPLLKSRKRSPSFFT